MPDWTLVNRSHVLAATAEHDRVESKEFLRAYGFRRSARHTLWHRGQEYDPAAVLAAAHLQATGRPVTSADVSGDDAAQVLAGLGFDVVTEEEAYSAPRPRRAAAPARARAKPEPELKVCPRCFTALPVTGVCDFCD